MGIPVMVFAAVVVGQNASGAGPAAGIRPWSVGPVNGGRACGGGGGAGGPGGAHGRPTTAAAADGAPGRAGPVAFWEKTAAGGYTLIPREVPLENLKLQ